MASPQVYSFQSEHVAAASGVHDLSACSAMVIDGNPTSRSILVGQLRDFGVGTIVQTSRLVDARRQLEYRQFDVVLCEHHFGNGAASGQDLLDDLRRNHLLPFFTVFIMVTGEATYTKVAEAAESALDGYLLKPHKASQLGERLYAARERKHALRDIFEAVECEAYELAAQLCMERFEARGPEWLYAARVGAELMLRIGQCAQAQTLYEAVVAAKTLPWAKLGVARAQLEDRQTGAAIATLENLIGEDPRYADAYDVMGRAQFEAGRFEQALATYKMAAELTPASITRLQNLGMVTFYAGDRKEAEALLERTSRLGLESKMFDCQSLVLLAFARLELGDTKGFRRCVEDFRRMEERHGESARYQRLATIMNCLAFIHDGQFAQVVDAVRTLLTRVAEPDFDFESAANTLGLLGQLASRAIRLDEVDKAVDAMGARFGISRAHVELLAGSCGTHQPYAERIRTAQTQVLRLTEAAMSLCLKGQPHRAVEDLIRHGGATCNAKMIETAHLVLQRYAEAIENPQVLKEQVQALRTRYSTSADAKAMVGEPTRPAGGVVLRTGIKPPKKVEAAG